MRPLELVKSSIAYTTLQFSDSTEKIGHIRDSARLGEFGKWSAEIAQAAEGKLNELEVAAECKRLSKIVMESFIQNPSVSEISKERQVREI